MHETMTIERLSQARGTTLYDESGEKIGSVEDIFQDYDTGEPEWIGVSAGMFGTKRALVPVQGADVRDDGVYVPYSKDQIKDAPNIDGDEIDESSERSLYTHYGLSYSDRRSESTLREGGPAMSGEHVGTTGERPGTMGAGDEADVRGRADIQGETDVQGEGMVTRHEEELRVGTQDVDAGQARLRKWVETEPEQVDVALRRETARVTREPVDRPAGEGEIGEEEIDVPLRGEEAVLEKETVAKERVGLEKDVETERETVGDEVRKEQIDVEGDVDRR
jgi:uncharacterized protein (TIGR02271 family)